MSTVVSAISARSAVGLESVSTVVTALNARIASPRRWERNRRPPQPWIVMFTKRIKAPSSTSFPTKPKGNTNYQSLVSLSCAAIATVPPAAAAASAPLSWYRV